MYCYGLLQMGKLRFSGVEWPCSFTLGTRVGRRAGGEREKSGEGRKEVESRQAGGHGEGSRWGHWGIQG